MRALLQRAISASVEADDEVIGSIDRGVVILLGVGDEDGPADVSYLAEKLLHLRIFADDHGRLNHSLVDTRGACLLISQFTLFANTRGRRPDFLAAAPHAVAAPLVEEVGRRLSDGGARVVEGRFGAHMVVWLHNDGPITILLDSRERT
jgi:D-tyrosyl-tRNA(Tyr) deacylase